GPPKAIGKGLFSDGFTAVLLTERFAAGRSMNSLVTGLSRQGAEISAATLAGTCARAAGLPEPLAGAGAGRNRASWHLHAGETTRRVFAPGARAHDARLGAARHVPGGRGGRGDPRLERGLGRLAVEAAVDDGRGRPRSRPHGHRDGMAGRRR